MYININFLYMFPATFHKKVLQILRLTKLRELKYNLVTNVKIKSANA